MNQEAKMVLQRLKRSLGATTEEAIFCFKFKELHMTWCNKILDIVFRIPLVFILKLLSNLNICGKEEKDIQAVFQVSYLKMQLREKSGK